MKVLVICLELLYRSYGTTLDTPRWHVECRAERQMNSNQIKFGKDEEKVHPPKMSTGLLEIGQDK